MVTNTAKPNMILCAWIQLEQYNSSDCAYWVDIKTAVTIAY